MKNRIVACVLFAVLAAAAWAQDGSQAPAVVPELKPGPAIVPAAAGPAMTVPQALVLGAVEGITEFLPVSSTGHLLIAQRLMGIGRTEASRSAANSYAICIQLGAILAVLLVSFGRVKSMVLGIVGKDRQGLKLAASLVVAAVPGALVGFFLEDRIKQYLFSPWYIAAAWIVGGAFILLFMRKKGAEGGIALEELSWQKALVIGFVQCIALWPGVSRSLATIAGGMLLGLSVSAAVEFGFLLGLVTLGGATIFEGIKRGPEIIAMFGWLAPLAGLLAAGITAFIAVKWMLSYLKKNSPAVFGWYRLGIGVFLVALILRGYL